MNLTKYLVISDTFHETYKFVSEGPKGKITKVVSYQEIKPGVYNLAFGDWDEKKQKIDDIVRSNNHDRNKVLATIASTVVDFMKHHPESSLFAKGNSPARTRLYQFGIANNGNKLINCLILKAFIKTSGSHLKRVKITSPLFSELNKKM